MEAPSAGAARDSGLKLGLRQFAVLAHRQVLVKRRAPLATLVEVMACVVLMSLLVLGADMSRVVDYPQRVYADKGVNVSSSAYAFVKDLVEFESEELCANITDDDWNATAWLVNRTSAASDAASNASATAADGLSLLAGLVSDPSAARAAADTQAFLVRRLGLVATVAPRAPSRSPRARPTRTPSLAVFRELQSQSRAGVHLGLDADWTRLLNDADTSSWDALVEDAVTPLHSNRRRRRFSETTRLSPCPPSTSSPPRARRHVRDGGERGVPQVVQARDVARGEIARKPSSTSASLDSRRIRRHAKTRRETQRHARVFRRALRGRVAHGGGRVDGAE